MSRLAPPPPSPLLTDWYQLTMLEAYLEGGMTAPATFEFSVRRLPPRRGFLVAAGLEQVVEYLEGLRFSDADLEWLRSTRRFSATLLDALARLRFTGDVDAMPEGTICFADEPLLRVHAPLPEAQLVETRLLQLVHFQTLVASKAARMVLAAPGRRLVEFGLRRAHGAEAGLLAARAAVLAGFDGTSNVLAAAVFGLTPYGTMAHSFVEVHDHEADAFARFARARPENVVLLLDTYDTEAAAETVVRLAPRLEAYGLRIHGVRLDSGDLAEHARRVRRILDAGGLRTTTIFASGNLDEEAIRSLVESGAPIDGFGPGTRLVTSADAPYLESVYKLMEYAGRPRMKWSEGKLTWPGAKQVYRRREANGTMRGDVVELASAPPPDDAEPLLVPILRNGRRVAPAEPFEALRARAAAGLRCLPEPLRRLATEPPYPVEIGRELRALAARLMSRSTRRRA